ncbi:MAG: hypothetical protein LUF68_04480, partial [Clostridiales bacterium]|nr:hypothetical protein [Clostridiales bacterium]
AAQPLDIMGDQHELTENEVAQYRLIHGDLAGPYGVTMKCVKACPPAQNRGAFPLWICCGEGNTV